MSTGTHDHEHGPARHGAGLDGTQPGQEARAAKDQPGRHDEGYYGAPGPGPARRAVAGQGQGSRSFGAFTRRRRG